MNENKIIKKVLQKLFEEDGGGGMAAGASTGGLTSAGSGTNTFSVLGTTDSPTFGGWIGPFAQVYRKTRAGKRKKKNINRKLFWNYPGAKNSKGGVGKIVTAPQGYVSEYLFTDDDKMITEGDLYEWFGQDLKQKPSWNGGKLVAIEPKCLAFPYCSQGAIDKPIKLIGETKDEMCPHCYEYCEKVGNEVGKTPEEIAKIIRAKYLLP